jgi:hypothetical protein
LAPTRRPHPRATLIAASLSVPTSNPPQFRNGLCALAISKTEPVSSLLVLLNASKRLICIWTFGSPQNSHVIDMSLPTATTLAQTKSASQRPLVAPSDTSTSRSAAHHQNAVTAVSNCPAYVLLPDIFAPNCKVSFVIFLASVSMSLLTLPQ